MSLADAPSPCPTHFKPLNRQDQAALLTWLTDALVPVLSQFAAPLFFATWVLRPGEDFPDAPPVYEGAQRGVIVRAGSSTIADYLLLLEQGAWARARPITVAKKEGNTLTYDLEPLEPVEIIDSGCQLDCIVDALLDAFINDDGEHHVGNDNGRDAIDDDRRAEALALLSSTARLPGVIALRRRTEESRQCLLAWLRLASKE